MLDMGLYPGIFLHHLEMLFSNLEWLSLNYINVFV